MSYKTHVLQDASFSTTPSFTASSLLLPHHPLLAVIMAGLGGMLCFLLTGTHEILGGLEKARDRERREQRYRERREQTALSATPCFPPRPIFSCATLGSQSGFIRVLFCKRDLFLYCSKRRGFSPGDAARHSRHARVHARVRKFPTNLPFFPKIRHQPEKIQNLRFRGKNGAAHKC